MIYRIVHCADLHLDSPLRGLSGSFDAPVALLRGASRAAFDNLIDLAIAENVSVVLIAGDIFDGDWLDWHTGQYFVRGLRRLADAGIRVVAISGNHDAASVISKDIRGAWPPGATLLGHNKPETVSFPDLDLSIHGQSFATKAVTENLALNYPRPTPGHLNIGLLHTALDGRAGHEPYAPCTIQQLRDFDYEYWALGHVHQRAELHRNPWIVFPGNLQARHINEAGEKGATLITVDDRKIVSVEHRVLDVIRWQRLTLDASACDTADAVESAWLRLAGEAIDASSGRLLAVRLRIEGASPAHADLMRDPLACADRLRNVAVARFEAGLLWLERIEIATTPARAASVADPDAEPLLRLLSELPVEPATNALASWAADLLAKTPGLRETLPLDHPAMRLAAGEMPADLLAQAQALLRARLDAV